MYSMLIKVLRNRSETCDLCEHSMRIALRQVSGSGKIHKMLQSRRDSYKYIVTLYESRLDVEHKA